MAYGEDGRQGDHRLVTEPDTLQAYIQLARSTWDAAVPLNEFIARPENS